MLNSMFGLIVAIAAMLTASKSFAAQYQIAFQVGTTPVPPMVFDPATDLGRANNALLARYGGEFGFLGTSAGNNNELLVLVNNGATARVIWNKMVRANDAYTAANGIGYFVYDEPTFPTPNPPMPPAPQPPQSQFRYLGRLNIAENSTGRFFLPNGTPDIKGFVVSMDVACPYIRGAVELVNPSQPIQPTRLVRTQRSSRTVSYEHSVNGDFGALVTALDLTIGRIGGPIITDVCPVDFYGRF